ncbi:MAG: rhomboid family intramembrane serine protease [Verrucomicrobia bacterium]|nr:rhomboid family intramembrane serine protease [Verrucomicrobiota bacterium]
MRCPECNQVLDPLQTEAYSALVCRACGGMFYPEAEFNKHLDVVQRILPPQITVQEVAPPKTPGRLMVGERGAACPGCGGPMKTFNYAYRSGIFLGRCPSCGGLWVEPGQMLRIARFRVMDPGVTHMSAGVLKGPDVAEEYEPLGYDDDMDRQLPHVNVLGPLGCLVGGLPVSNAPALSRPPVVMWALVGLTVAAYFIGGAAYGIENWSFIPREVVAKTRLETLLTHQFAHIGKLHLVSNMMFLLAFGDRVEDRLRSIPFLFLYLALGVIAALAHVSLQPNSTVPCLGASGAVSGVLGLYIVLFPWSSVRVALVAMSFPVPAILFVGVWFLGQLALPLGGQVAVMAHLGGFFAGIWIGGLVRILRLGEKKRRR